MYDLSERQVVISAGEGTNLDLTLTSIASGGKYSQEEEDIPKPTAIAFVHNSSQLVDFSATILVDRFSNSLLNLSVYGAKGVLNGSVVIILVHYTVKIFPITPNLPFRHNKQNIHFKSTKIKNTLLLLLGWCIIIEA